MAKLHWKAGGKCKGEGQSLSNHVGSKGGKLTGPFAMDGEIR